MYLQKSTACVCKVISSCIIVGYCISIYNAELTGSEEVLNKLFSASVSRSLMFHSFVLFPPMVIFVLLGEGDWLCLNTQIDSLCTQE